MQIRVEKAIKKPLFKHQNVAAYARVSVENELTDHSLANQIEYYKSYINKRPLWNFIGVYADEGITGTKLNRPGFQNLLKDCENGKINIVLTKSISRFARNTVDLLNETRHLKELGINVWFEKENLWSISPEGELMLTLLASFAQEESRSVSENTKWIIQKRFAQGIGNNYFLFGYKWDGKTFQIVPEQAEIVLWIYENYLKGMTPDHMATILRQRGIKSARGNDFSYSLVWNILRLEKYKGESLLQKTYVENHLSKKKIRNHGQMPMYHVTETHPPIVSSELFDAVQNEIQRRAELGYLANQSISFSCFTSKIVCEKCGRTYRRRMSGTKGRKTKHYKWMCGKKIEGTSSACDSQNVPEKALYELTMELLQTDNLTQEFFNEHIDHITVSDHCTLIFHMKDGSVIKKRWQVKTKNTKIRETINGKDSYDCTTDQEQI